MRLISVLRAQHLDRMFKKHWAIQGKRKLIDTGAETALKAKGIPVVDAFEVAGLKKNERIVLTSEENRKLDPNYHERKCHIFEDHNVLLEGVNQGLVLTKSVQLIQNSLPEHIENTIKEIEVSDQIHGLVKNAIYTANVFDAEQELLPKVKDPLRPAFNFPRRRGITDQRKNFLLSSKLLALCEMTSKIFSKRNIIKDAFFSLHFERDNDLIQFKLHAENLVIASEPIKPVLKDIQQTESLELHNLFPIKSTITIPQENVYKLNNIYPLTDISKMDSPHTLLLNFAPTYVHNLFETPVTSDQTLGRSLIKSFTAAVAYAKRRYGDTIETLPEPITVQCIQTDGRLFDFSVFQLNTINLNGNNGLKNVWYQTKQMPLYKICTYDRGIPILEEYNPSIIKYLFALYRNQ